jgi:hypothetical protein
MENKMAFGVLFFCIFMSETKINDYGY